MQSQHVIPLLALLARIRTKLSITLVRAGQDFTLLVIVFSRNISSLVFESRIGSEQAENHGKTNEKCVGGKA